MATKSHSYKKSILKALYFSDALSCTELSDKIGKSYSLVTKTVEEMTQEKLIQTDGYALSNGGRRSLTYSLLPSTFYLVAVAMDQFVTKIALLDARRTPVIPTVKLALNLNNTRNALEILAGEIAATIAKAPVDKHKIIGIGIGMPGFIDAAKGANYTFLGENTRSYIEEKTKLPVFIENDSSAIALAEYQFGKAIGANNAMIVNLSWGIGLGMIIDRKLFRGDDGFAGEFSHIPIFKNGRLCGCGKTGCLETESSLSFMIDRAKEEIGNGRASALDYNILSSGDYEEKSVHFIKTAKSGDSLAIEIISDAGYNIGRGIAILIHILNPGKIILSGRCAEAGNLWLPPVKRAINEFCIPRLLNRTEIVTSDFNQSAEVIGASALAVEHIEMASFSKIIKKKHVGAAPPPRKAL